MTNPLPDEIDDGIWDEAYRRAAAIRQFVKRSYGLSTAADVADLATELELSQASAYRLLKKFRADGTVMSLVETKRGRRTGHRALEGRREEIIQQAIRTYYLQPTRPSCLPGFRMGTTATIAADMKSVSRDSQVKVLKCVGTTAFLNLSAKRQLSNLRRLSRYGRPSA